MMATERAKSNVHAQNTSGSELHIVEIEHFVVELRSRRMPEQMRSVARGGIVPAYWLVFETLFSTGGHSEEEVHKDINALTVHLSDGSQFSVGDFPPASSLARWLMNKLPNTIRLSLTQPGGLSKCQDFSYQDLVQRQAGDILLSYHPFHWQTTSADQSEGQVLTNGQVALTAEPTPDQLLALGLNSKPPRWQTALEHLAGYDENDWADELNRQLALLDRHSTFYWSTDAHGERYLTDGVINLSGTYPAAAERKNRNIPSVGADNWPSALEYLLGKPSEGWRAQVGQFAANLPFHWENGLLVNGMYTIDPAQRLRRLPWGLEVTDAICPAGLWAAFVRGLEGLRPSEVRAHMSGFATQVFPFDWVAENGATSLTDGRLTFPRNYPNPRRWRSLRPLVDPIAPRHWRWFLDSLVGQTLQPDQMRPFFDDYCRRHNINRLTIAQQQVIDVIGDRHNTIIRHSANGPVIFQVERQQPLGTLYIIGACQFAVLCFFATLEEADLLADSKIDWGALPENQVYKDQDGLEAWQRGLAEILDTLSASAITRKGI